MRGDGGTLRLLVNNAAIFEPDTAAAPDLALFERHFAINLRAPVLLAAAFHARWPGGGDAGIVNLIDQRVLRPDARFFSYTLAKSALWTATRTMAQAFAAKGVRVNAVGPGPVLPNAVDGDDGFAAEVAAVPLGHAVDPDEVAAAVLYLAEARSVTGQFLAVDAGQHLGVRAREGSAGRLGQFGLGDRWQQFLLDRLVGQRADDLGGDDAPPVDDVGLGHAIDAEIDAGQAAGVGAHRLERGRRRR